MSKSKNVEEILNTIEKVVKSLIELARLANECVEEIQKIKANLTVETPKKAEPVKEEVKLPTLEEVRTVLADLSRKGYTTNVRLMLIGFGVSKLSEVDPKDYPELLAKAKELQDATKE